MTTGCVIAGAAETSRLGVIPDMSMMGLNVEAGWRALNDAGLRACDIDGVAGAYSPHGVADAMGIKANWIDTTNVGGCSFMFHVRHAVAAIRAGHVRRVLVTHGESNRSRVGVPPRPRDPASSTGQFEEPYGARPPYTKFTLPALRYMHEKGLGERDLAEVVVAQRRWSSRNPRAGRRDLLTVEEVLASPLVAYPFRTPEICMMTDGGGALVVTAADEVPSSASPVAILGTGEATDSPVIFQQREAGSSRAIRAAGDAAFAEAGLARDEIDHVMVYDAFAHLPWIGLENLGFAEPGGAAELIASGATSPGGRLPLNTNGGGLAYTHTGMYGMFAIQESVRQLRGEAAAQVPDVKVSLALGLGGMLTAAGVLLLARHEN